MGMALALGSSCQHQSGEHAEQSAQRWQQLADAISADERLDSSLLEALRRTGFMATLSELVCLTALKGSCSLLSSTPCVTIIAVRMIFSFCTLQGLIARITLCSEHMQRWWHPQAYRDACLSASWQLRAC